MKRKRGDKMYDKGRYEKNKDKINKRERKRYKNSPGVRRKHRERDKKRRESVGYKKEIKEYGKKYRKENPEAGRKKERKRRAIKENIIETFSDKEWLQKLKDTFGVCPKCNKYVGIHKLTLDHIKPISKAKEGQIYSIDDVQPLCHSCNSRKGNRIE